VLADPSRHIELDGSGMLRGAVTDDVVTGVGDVFVMAMYYSEHGDYEMNNHVVEFELNRRIGWEPVNGRGHPDGEGTSSPNDRWQQRWIFELLPDGDDATIVTEIYDCSRATDVTGAGGRSHLDRSDDQDVGTPRSDLPGRLPRPPRSRHPPNAARTGS
jgi:hypothetical protein